MVIALGELQGESKVAATDSNNQLLTHVECLDELYNHGLRFEAAVAQMALVEALLLFYLKARIQSDGVTVVEDIDKLRRQRRLTFGTVKDIVVRNGVLHDRSIEADLIEYVDYRNDLAHNLISTFSSVDLSRFYSAGQRLVEFFRAFLFAVVKRHMG